SRAATSIDIYQKDPSWARRISSIYVSSFLEVESFPVFGSLSLSMISTRQSRPKPPSATTLESTPSPSPTSSCRTWTPRFTTETPATTLVCGEVAKFGRSRRCIGASCDAARRHVNRGAGDQFATRDERAAATSDADLADTHVLPGDGDNPLSRFRS